MTSSEFLNAIRRRLDDYDSPAYKWNISELIDYINYTFDEVARDTDYFKDAYTEAIVELPITAGTPDYALDARTIRIGEVRVSGQTVNLSQVDSQELFEYTNTWRYKESIFGTDIAFVDSNPDTITSTTTDFTDANFDDDDYIQISGSTSNDSIVLSADVAATVITLDSGASLTAEAAGDNVLLRSINTGTPLKYTTDYRDGYITLYPAPDTSGLIFMTATRWPLTAWTTANYSTESLPYNSHYHLGLVHGVCSYAYMKSGAPTYNDRKAAESKLEFELLKKKIKRDLISMRNPATILSPHSGTL